MPPRHAGSPPPRRARAPAHHDRCRRRRPTPTERFRVSVYARIHETGIACRTWPLSGCLFPDGTRQPAGPAHRCYWLFKKHRAPRRGLLRCFLRHYAASVPPVKRLAAKRSSSRAMPSNVVARFEQTTTTVTVTRRD